MVLSAVSEWAWSMDPDCLRQVLEISNIVCRCNVMLPNMHLELEANII